MRKAIMRLKWLIGTALLLTLAVGHPVRAQNGITGNLNASSTDCLTTNSCLILNIPENVGGATIKLSGTFSATIQFEVSADPSNVLPSAATWVSISATPSNSTTTATSATAPGVWQINLSGYQRIRIRVSTYVSGTVSGAINLSTASARSGGGGGGGGTIGGTAAAGKVAFGSGVNSITSSGGFLYNPTGALGGFGPSLSIADSNSCGLTPITYFTVCNSVQTITSFGLTEIIGSAGSGGSYSMWDTVNGVGNTGTTRGTFTWLSSFDDGAYSLQGITNGKFLGGVVIDSSAATVPYALEVGVYGQVNQSLQTELFVTPDKGIEMEIFAPAFGLTVDNGIYLTPTPLGNGTQGTLAMSATAPTVAAAGCGVAGASISANNGTAAFTVNVGTTNSGTCTITMPAAKTDWACGATDITTTSTLVSMTKSVPGGTPTTQIILQNYTDVSATHAWVDSDKIQVICMAE